MGAAFLVALRGHQVVGVDHRAITMVPRTGSRLKAYRGEVDPAAVLAWKLCGSRRSDCSILTVIQLTV
jgi:hypothetical protein